MNSNIRAIGIAAGALASFLCLAIPARAQSVTATLVGTVFDASGAAVPQPKISVTNKGTNEIRIVTGTDRGDYTIPNLLPGLYQLAAEHEGFRRTLVGEF